MVHEFCIILCASVVSTGNKTGNLAIRQRLSLSGICDKGITEWCVIMIDEREIFLEDSNKCYSSCNNNAWMTQPAPIHIWSGTSSSGLVFMRVKLHLAVLYDMGCLFS